MIAIAKTHSRPWPVVSKSGQNEMCFLPADVDLTSLLAALGASFRAVFRRCFTKRSLRSRVPGSSDMIKA